MAYYGLSNPYMAKLNLETEAYSDGFACGKAISTSVTPNNSSTSLFANNEEAERVDEFVNATVEVGTDRLPVTAENVLFGHAINSNDEVVSNAEDNGNYVGYGFYQVAMEDGVKKYRACVVNKVKFAEGAESYQTKGENIVFQTPTLSGTARTLKNGNWRVKSPVYTNLSETIAWLKGKLNIEVTYTAVTPATGDNPKANGWFERSGTSPDFTYTLTSDTTVSDQKTYYAAS